MKGLRGHSQRCPQRGPGGAPVPRRCRLAQEFLSSVVALSDCLFDSVRNGSILTVFCRVSIIALLYAEIIFTCPAVLIDGFFVLEYYGRNDM